MRRCQWPGISGIRLRRCIAVVVSGIPCVPTRFQCPFAAPTTDLSNDRKSSRESLRVVPVTAVRRLRCKRAGALPEPRAASATGAAKGQHKRLRAPDPGHRPVGGGRSFGIDSTRGGHTDRALRASSVPRGPRPAVTGPSRNRPRRRPRCCPYCRLRRRPGCDLRRRRSTAFPAARSTCPAEPRQPQQTKQQRTRSRAYH